MTVRNSENIMELIESDYFVDSAFDAIDLIPIDKNLAYKRLLDLAANGSILSMIYVGDAYLYGDAFCKDPTEGLKWLRRASDAGSKDAMFRIACHYRWLKDFSSARNEFLKLAELKYSPAIYILGHMEYAGEGSDVNIERAVEFWKMAGGMGHFYGRQWYSYLLRQGYRGVFGKINGVGIIVKMLIPFIYYRLYFPKSDRLRTC